MNNLNAIEYSTEKVNAFSIKKSEHVKYFALALGKNTVMKKHKTPVPATLLVLKGKIDFMLPNETLAFKAGDFYEIPVGVEHEVLGIEEENLFTIVQEF